MSECVSGGTPNAQARVSARKPARTGGVGEAGDVLVGDLGGALLEGGVDEALVGVLLDLGVEPVGDEVLDRHLDRAHVHAARQVQVAVQQVPVPSEEVVVVVVMSYM